MSKNFARILSAAFAILFLQKDISAQENLSADSIGTALNFAFKNKNAKDLLPFLAKNFTVGVHSRPAAENLLQGILKQYPVDSLVQQQTETVKDKKQIALTIYSKGKSSSTYAWCNSKNELLYIDLFDRLYGVDKYAKSTLKARIPFHLTDGSIVITATINNNKKLVNLLFDTGADGMALNKEVADSLGLTISRQQTTSVVGGNQQINISSGNLVQFDTLKIPDNNIAIFEKVSDKYDGIMGVTLAGRFITKVDFDKEIIELYSIGRYEFEKEGTTLDISMPSGIPIVPVSLKVGNKDATGDFVFDTGAGYYLISFSPFTKSKSLISLGFIPYYSGVTTSMGHSSTTLTGNFANMNLGEIQMQDFPGALQAPDAATQDWVNTQSGSVGIKAIRRFNFTINLANQTIHLTPNKNYSLPFDFVLGGLYLSFNKDRQLFVESIVAKKAEDKFQAGDIILSVNKIKSEELLKKPEKIKQLLQPSATKYLIKYSRDNEVLETAL